MDPISQNIPDKFSTELKYQVIQVSLENIAIVGRSNYHVDIRSGLIYNIWQSILQHSHGLDTTILMHFFL